MAHFCYISEMCQAREFRVNSVQGVQTCLPAGRAAPRAATIRLAQDKSLAMSQTAGDRSALPISHKAMRDKKVTAGIKNDKIISCINNPLKRQRI